MRDTFVLPPYPNRGPDFEERLYMATDGEIDNMIEEDNRMMREMANTVEAFETKDPDSKDTDLLAKVNLIAQAVQVDKPPISAEGEEIYFKEPTARRSLPEFKRIMTDDIYRVLLLNNENPEK